MDGKEVSLVQVHLIDVAITVVPESLYWSHLSAQTLTSDPDR